MNAYESLTVLQKTLSELARENKRVSKQNGSDDPDRFMEYSAAYYRAHADAYQNAAKFLRARIKKLRNENKL